MLGKIRKKAVRGIELNACHSFPKTSIPQFPIVFLVGHEHVPRLGHHAGNLRILLCTTREASQGAEKTGARNRGSAIFAAQGRIEKMIRASAQIVSIEGGTAAAFRGHIVISQVGSK